MGKHVARLLRRVRSDEGFSLIEATTAMVLVIIIFVGLMQSLAISLRSLRENRLQQQATVLALEGIEFARSLTWDELAMNPAHDPDDPNVSNGKLDGKDWGFTGQEQLVEIDEVPGALNPYLTTEILDKTTFDTYSYVTDAGGGLRRVMVVVEWNSGGNADHQHATSTLISEVSAG